MSDTAEILRNLSPAIGGLALLAFGWTYAVLMLRQFRAQKRKRDQL